MAAIAEPPAPTAATPQSALANFLKVESGIADVASPPPAPATKPTAPPTPPPPEKPSPPAAPPSDDKAPTNAQKWKEFTTARDTAIKEREDRIASLQADMKKITDQASRADDPEKVTLKKERDELSQKLWTVSRERHPEFLAKYDKQIDNALSMVQKIIGGDAGKQLVKLLKSGDPETRDEQVEKLLEEAGAFKMSRVSPIINTLDQLQGARSQELDVSKEDFDRMVSEHEATQKAQAATQAKQQRAMVEQMFDHGLKGFRDKEKGLRELQERDGDDAWNNSLKTKLHEAKEIISGNAKPERVIQAILHDAAFDTVKADRDALLEKNKALEAQVAAFISTVPGLRLPGNPGGDVPNRPVITSATTPQDALKQWLKVGNEQT